MANVCACDPDLHHAQSPDGGRTWICGHCGQPRGACQHCTEIDAGGSAYCDEHQRGQIADGCDPKLAAVVAALADLAGVQVVDKRKPSNVSITADVVEVNGARIVRLVIPAGAQSVAAALPPDIAIRLGKVLIQQAGIAKSPAGLILPGS